MKRFFFDTEFIEGMTNPLFGKPQHFVELISIGIVCEDGREYYAVNSEFNLKRAWNDHTVLGDRKEYWIRDNVIKPVVRDLSRPLSYFGWDTYNDAKTAIKKPHKYVYMGDCLTRYPVTHTVKSLDQIKNDIIDFVHYPEHRNMYIEDVQFYAYYASYDWVMIGQIFGKMLNITKTDRCLPMYCRDLKQMLDETLEKTSPSDYFEHFHKEVVTLQEKLKVVKGRPDYPQQVNEHHALADARWNMELYNFIKKLQSCLS
jgi:hypothetical protein